MKYIGAVVLFVLAIFGAMIVWPLAMFLFGALAGWIIVTFLPFLAG